MHAIAPKTGFQNAAAGLPCEHNLLTAGRTRLRDCLASTFWTQSFILLLGTFLATWTACWAKRHTNGLLLWPVSGLVTAYSLRCGNVGLRRRLGLLAVIAVGILLGALGAAQDLAETLQWEILTGLDLVIVNLLLEPYVATFENLKNRLNMARFVVAVTLAPVVSGLVATLPFALHHRERWAQAVGASMLADVVGFATLTPAALFATTGEYRRLHKLAPHLRSAAGAFLLFLSVASFVFWQTRGPFLFLVFPPMMLVLLLLGLEGAVFCSIALTTIGWIATAHGHGPIWLMAGASPTQRLIVLQTFVWVCLASAIPVGASLDERRRAERAAQEAQEIYQLLLQHTTDAIILSSLDGTRRYASPMIEQLTGWTPAEYLAFKRQETLHPDDRDIVALVDHSLQTGKREQTIRYRLRQKQGGWLWVEATVRAYGNAQILGYVGTIRDISAQRQTEKAWLAERNELTQQKQEMAALVGVDPLTSLLNRRGLEESLRQVDARIAPMAVLMIDIDYFKQFNDTYGHQAGDRCLTQLGIVIRRHAARQGDLVARLGGEEFTVVLPNTDARGGMAVADAICRDLQQLGWQHTSSPLGFVSVSVGVAAQTEQQVDFNMLLAHADRALYASKHGGRNRSSLHPPATTAATTGSRSADASLECAALTAA